MVQSTVTWALTFFWSHDAQNFQPLQQGFFVDELLLDEDLDEEELLDEPVPFVPDVEEPPEVEGVLDELLAIESRR